MNARFALVVSLALVAPALAADPQNPAMDEHLAPLVPMLGKTWRGELKNAQKPTFDVQRWERALNGKAVRILHSVNDGEYGGESLVVYDREKKKVIFYYFTTAGFYTTGEATLSAGRFVALEKVVGPAGGVTEVRSTTELKPDGTMLVKSEHLKDGKWVAGRETTYRADPKAEVKFR